MQVAFPEFSDPLYGGTQLNVQYAVKSFCEAVEEEVELAGEYMRSLSSDILRIDGGFKMAKKVRTGVGEPAFRETTTVMNDKGMIVGLYLGSGGLAELEDPLCRLAQRNNLLRNGEVGEGAGVKGRNELFFLFCKACTRASFPPPTPNMRLPPTRPCVGWFKSYNTFSPRHALAAREGGVRGQLPHNWTAAAARVPQHAARRRQGGPIPRGAQDYGHLAIRALAQRYARMGAH